ncbi:protein Shroom isoform X4 [Folsomia candida]|uniref:protein Shroom isoform X4 n=1 Tax=Folsomia candida TaxID=158441 RepID=UPI001604D35D|nr:protein Shroom isoform X4 [Folsomia candida]
MLQRENNGAGQREKEGCSIAGLSIWKLDKPHHNHPPPCNSSNINNSPLKGKCGSTQALYSTPHRPLQYPVYSTLPRNHSQQGTVCSSPKPPTNVPPLSVHQRYHSSSSSSSGNGLPPIPTSTNSTTSNTSVLLSPARSTPNLGSSAKLQLTPQVQTPPSHPIYREPPTYTPGPVVNSYSLGRSKRQFPIGLRSSRSSENVKLLQDYSITTTEPIPTSTTATSKSSGASDHSPPLAMSSTLSGNSPSWLKDKSSANCTPVRDSSSLKGIRYGPGHEKYPSWPIPASSVAEVDPAGSASPSSSAKIDLAHGGSVRSKSWTESTDYPKEKVPSYARPYMKKMMMAAANSNSSNANSSSGYSHQLKTVLEKCEKAKQQERVGGGRGYHVLQPPQGYRDHQHQNNSQQQQQHPPAEKEYNIPSPPERDSGAVKPLTQEDVENYSKKYEELLSQYAGSEGYHSYISSECSSSSYVSSSSTTPFLDLLRRESGDLLNHQHHYQPFYDHLDPSDPLFALAHLAANRSGRESVTTVVTNSSGSSSGTETLKCFGSASDVSIASSSNNRWDSHKHPGKHSPSNKSPHSPTKSWSPPTSDLSSREINLKKFPLSTYTRPSTLSLEKQQQQQQQIQPEKDTPSPTSATTPPAPSKCQEPQNQPSSNSPIIDTSKPPSVAERIWELEQKQSREKIASSLPPQPPPPIISMSSSSSLNSSSNSNSLSFKRVTQLGPGGLSHSSETLPLTSSLIQSIKEEAAAKAAAAAAQQQQQSLPPISTTATTTNVSSSSAYKNLWNGGEKETPTTPPTENATSTATSSPTTEIKNSSAGGVPSVQGTSSSSSICGEGENISYSYLDPEKKHKVADMTLKAIQKKALLSYYERHAGKGEGAPASAAASTSHNKGAVDANQGDNKSEHGKDDGTGANERLGFMTKYNSGQLAGRDGVVNGWQSNGASLGGAHVVGNFNNPKLNNGATNNNAITSSSSEPPPPERPPKKPHLRQFNPHQVDNNDPMNHDSSPPPPLPRAPIRPPAPNPSSSPVKANLVSGVPPVPSKPVVGVPINAGIVTMARSPSPDLPLPPPPPIAEEEEVEVVDNDEPLPPPPSLTEVSNCLGSRSRSVSGLSSYLHKDSYLAQRKERTLGYEGRYRRTLSPSGMGSNNNNSHKSENGGGVVVGIPPQHPIAPRSMQHMATSTSTTTTSSGKLDTSLTPSGWEKYHNIRPPSTTVIFSSHELPKPVSPTVSGFTRSVSCDSNLFNNKTGFTQSTIPPPVAQVAPLRDPYYHHYHYAQSQSSLLEFEKVVAVEPFHHESSSSSSSSASSSSSLTFLPNGSDLHLLHNGTYEQHNPPPLPPSINKANTVMVSPLQYNSDHRSRNYQNPNHEKMGQTKSTSLKDKSLLKNSELSLRVNCTSDVGSQTELKEKENLNNGSSPSPTQNIEKKTTATSPIRSGSSSSTTSSSSSSGGSCSSSFDDSSGGGGSSSSSAKGSSGLSGGGSFSVIPSYTGRQKSKEELECEELSRSLIKKLPQGDKLQKILVPLPEHKTTADYMEGLFQLELKLSKPEKEEKETNTSPRSSPDLLQSLPKGDGGKNPSKTPSPTLISQQDDKNVFGNKGGSAEDGSQDSNKRCNGHAPLPADSAYFTTSECKAKFLTQYVNDMNSKSSPCKGQDSQELNQQKEMLVSRISRKLEILRTEQLEIREEIESNEDLGHQVVERVKGSAKRNEFDKFKLHVEEIEKITSLLLGLSGRLARAENALMSLTENNSNPQEKKILESKRDKLREQLEEAKGLKENIDRRSAQVSIILQKYLTAEDYADYHHFVKMKAKLIIDAREIDDKIKLGEEQMVALKDTLSSYPASS